MRRIALTLLSLSLLGVAPLASPAGAAKPSLPKVTDDVGDVESRENQGDAGIPALYSIDIKSMKVSYTETRLKAIVRYTDVLISPWTQMTLLIDRDGDGASLYTAVVTAAEKSVFDPMGELVGECPLRFKVSKSLKVMRMSMPSSCLGTPIPTTISSIRAEITADDEGGRYFVDSTDPLPVPLRCTPTEGGGVIIVGRGPAESQDSPRTSGISVGCIDIGATG